MILVAGPEMRYAFNSTLYTRSPQIDLSNKVFVVFFLSEKKGEENWGCMLYECDIYFWGGHNVLELDTGNGCIIL